MRASAEAGIVGCEATLVEIDPDDDYTNDVQLIIEPESESDPVSHGMGSLSEPESESDPVSHGMVRSRLTVKVLSK